MQCFPQRLPEGSSPFPCSYHLQRLRFTLPSRLRLRRGRMSPSTYCPLATGKWIYGWVGWLPGSPFPLGNHQSDTRHIDPFCRGEGSQCVLHFPGLPIVQSFSRESQKLGEGGSGSQGQEVGVLYLQLLILQLFYSMILLIKLPWIITNTISLKQIY